MKTVRASEIAAYIFCHRAWYYQIKGYPAENQSAMSAGTHLHEHHGRTVQRIQILRRLAYALLMAALLCATLAIVLSIL